MHQCPHCGGEISPEELEVVDGHGCDYCGVVSPDDEWHQELRGHDDDENLYLICPACQAAHELDYF